MAHQVAESVIETLLANATEETIVHIDYVAGRAPCARAIEEAEMASDWEKPNTSYVGHFKGLRRTKKGDLVLTLWVHNRGEVGAYRAFNPRLGHVRDIRIVS